MEKNKKRAGSLYVYLVISFIVILIIVLLSTALYFGARNANLFNIYEDKLTELDVNEIIGGLKNAIIYGIVVGGALMLVVAKYIIKPLKKIKDATKKVASGNFDVKVDISRKDEIGDLADNFNIMVNELNSIEYLRKDFVSNISHELKTPIASIQGFAKLLKDKNLNEKDKEEYINIILEETDRLSNLSSNMIKLSKVENQEIVFNKQKFRLDEQLRKAIIMLEEKMDKKNIKIELNSKEISIIENQDLMMEVWINLLNNAIKYTKENGKIKINVSEEKDFIKVDIKDNGIGIPKEKQERIFEKFYQVEKSHSNEGSGLGLAIVKRIIELIGGTITFTSEENKGTAFTVSIKKLEEKTISS